MGKEDENEGFEEFHNIFSALYKAHCFKEKPATRGRNKSPISPWLLKV